MSPIGLLLIGAGIVLVFAAFRDVSPIDLVTDTLTGGGKGASSTPAGSLGPHGPVGP